MTDKNIHWPYYLSFESDINRLSRFIEITEANSSTFSVELTKTLLSSCAEIDAVLKEICKLINPDLSRRNINEYQKVITGGEIGLENEKAVILKYNMSFTPWESWKDGKTPVWWKEHNYVKHDRSKYFRKANLKNTILSISALYLANVYLNHLKLGKDTDFLNDLSQTVRRLPLDLDLIRIDCPFAYLDV